MKLSELFQQNRLDIGNQKESNGQIEVKSEVKLQTMSPRIEVARL